MGRIVSLLVAAVLGVVAGLAAVVLSTGSALALAVALGFVLVASLLQIRHLLFVLGLLMPLHTLEGVPEAATDLARYGCCFVLILRSIGDRAARMQPQSDEVILAFVALWSLVLATSRPDQLGLSLASVMLLSVTVVAFLRHGGLIAAPLWAGIVTSLSVNGLLIAAQAAGVLIPGLSTQFVGYGRYVGFGANAPLTSFELAAGLVLTLMIRRAPLRFFCQILMVAGLLASGGRGGLLAAVVAALVMLLASSVLRRRVLWCLAAAALFMMIASALSAEFLSTLNRVVNVGAAGFSSGRLEILASSTEAIAASPVLGIGIDEFVATYGAMPHMAVATLAIGGGLVAACGAVFLTLRVVGVLLRGIGEPSPRLGLAAVLLVWIAIEPSGPFAGLFSVLLLSYVLSPGRDPAPTSGSTTVPRRRKLVGYT